MVHVRGSWSRYVSPGGRAEIIVGAGGSTKTVHRARRGAGSRLPRCPGRCCRRRRCAQRTVEHGLCVSGAGDDRHVRPAVGGDIDRKVGQAGEPPAGSDPDQLSGMFGLSVCAGRRSTALTGKSASMVLNTSLVSMGSLLSKMIVALFVIRVPVGKPLRA